MAGAYIHVPFCRKACAYCNFHFSTTWKQMEWVKEAMLQEIPLKTAFMNEEISSIYFGGGTPSLLPSNTIHQFLNELHKNFPISSNPEVTVEVNPDDTFYQYFADLRKSGINRLSIGTQSFFDEDLHYLGRIHNANQAESSIQQAQKAGFGNLTIDFIYGIPTSTNERWKANLKKLNELAIPHFSAYALTIEPKTLLAHQVRHQKITPPNEQQYIDQFESLIQFAEKNGYDHYEISNFAKGNYHAIHNSSYWEFEPYIGIGPGAHSFDGINTRQWNISNNPKYVKLMRNQAIYYEQEKLNEENLYNEFIMTALRTKKGVNSNVLTSIFGNEYADHFEKEAQKWINQACLEKEADYYRLKPEKSLFADQIIADLFKA